MSCFVACCPIKKVNRPSASSKDSPSHIDIDNNSNFNDISPVSSKRRSKVFKGNHRQVSNQRINEKPSTIKPMYELKDKFRCIFCGWESCKHEDWKRNKHTVIEGLNCDKITEDLFASQRPSTILINKYNIIKRLEIGLIVNVQRQGEHPYCGPNKGLEQISGFTYNPEAFTTEGIRVRLSGWKDMNVPDSIPFMLEIIKDMLVTIKVEGRKALVHCHAGYGRTGIVLACYQIFISTKSAEKVVEEIRKVRKECVQKNAQLEYCKTFKNFIDRARSIFTSQKNDIEYFIKNQEDLSFGNDVNKFQHVPKILHEVLDKILNLKVTNNLDNMNIYQSLNGSSDWQEGFENSLVEIKKSLNRGTWNCLEKAKEINILTELCYDWLEDCVCYVVNPNIIEKLFKDDPGLSNKIKQNIVDPRETSKEERSLITNFLKQELRMIEFETITCIAHFASEIFPHDNLREKAEFRLMLEKLSIYILGYNIENLYDNDMKIYSEKLINIVDNLIDLILYCITVMKYDLVDWTNTNSFYDYQVEGQECLTRKPEDDTLIKNSNKIVHLSNYYNDKQNSKKITSSIQKTSLSTDKLSINANMKVANLPSHKDKKDLDKEREVLFNMYKSLHKYFFTNELNIDDNVSNGVETPINFNKFMSVNNSGSSKIRFVTNNSINKNDHFEMLNDFYENVYKLVSVNGSNNTFSSLSKQHNIKPKTQIKNLFFNVTENKVEPDSELQHHKRGNEKKVELNVNNNNLFQRGSKFGCIKENVAEEYQSGNIIILNNTEEDNDDFVINDENLKKLKLSEKPKVLSSSLYKFLENVVGVREKNNYDIKNNQDSSMSSNNDKISENSGDDPFELNKNTIVDPNKKTFIDVKKKTIVDLLDINKKTIIDTSNKLIVGSSKNLMVNGNPPQKKISFVNPPTNFENNNEKPNVNNNNNPWKIVISDSSPIGVSEQNSHIGPKMRKRITSEFKNGLKSDSKKQFLKRGSVFCFRENTVNPHQEEKDNLLLLENESNMNNGKLGVRLILKDEDY